MLKRFRRSETGTVTIDIVTISAVIVGFGMGVLLIVNPGIGVGKSTMEPEISGGLTGRLLVRSK